MIYMEKYICIHGHFYQPPRENPWLEAVELQDSAYPYHDWNERITAECYAPNATARILDGWERIEEIAEQLREDQLQLRADLAVLDEGADAGYSPRHCGGRQSEPAALLGPRLGPRAGL